MKIFQLIILGILLPHFYLSALCRGSVELAPVYIHLDVLDHKKTLTRFDMPAAKLSALWMVPNTGISVKPTVLYGKNHAEFFTTGVGVGFCIPLGEKWLVSPMVGYTYTRFNSDVPRPTPLGTLQFSEKLRSNAGYVGLEATYLIKCDLRIYGQYQYTWSHSCTKFGFFNPLTKENEMGTSKGDSTGPTVGAMVEYDLNECGSVNLGAAYNTSLSKEKLGLRGYGVKAGFVRWF